MNDETVIGLDLLTATIKDLQEALSDGKVTSVQLIQTYLDRIEANNKKGLELRAVMETAPRKQLMEIARARDEMRANRASIGPLHGIPILVKDNIATHPALGMNTTAGSYALLKSIPMEDATVIAKLRSAGAIILGKATMNEFANLKAFNAIEGWSARGGRGRSAYDVGGHGSDGAKPSGSSSGSAIAVSAGFSPAALGTETSGSLISPAGRAAAYTLRSTAGLVSRYGVIPGCKSFDTIGPITKSAWDTAVLLSCMAGLDPKDEATKDAEFPANKDYTRFTEMPYATFKGKRLGFPGHGAFDLDIPWGSVINDIVRSPAIKDALAAALEKMASLGAIVCDQAEIPSFPEWKALATSTPKYGLTIIAHEFKEDIEGYLATMQSTEVRNLQDIIE
ncbi:hypothetical protein QFC22_006336 [Naganishia vaughanmartiniae]|uniref:Uncharacterized protein n=1 Tax=Naganishia vaughanmartiniae TaxID=1424756 RepID=A0ACC2WKS8_9TREE|nr:hypothetical protein QFC22_006336 [Naganishia vaughanmartiniae]